MTQTQYVPNSGKMKYIGKIPVIIDEHIKCECSCKIKEKDCNKLQQYQKSQCKCNCINSDDLQKCLAVSFGN